MLRMHTHSPAEVRELYQVRAARWRARGHAADGLAEARCGHALLRKAVSKLDDPHPALSAHIDALAFYLLL